MFELVCRYKILYKCVLALKPAFKVKIQYLFRQNQNDKHDLTQSARVRIGRTFDIAGRIRRECPMCSISGKQGSTLSVIIAVVPVKKLSLIIIIIYVHCLAPIIVEANIKR